MVRERIRRRHRARSCVGAKEGNAFSGRQISKISCLPTARWLAPLWPNTSNALKLLLALEWTESDDFSLRSLRCTALRYSRLSLPQTVLATLTDDIGRFAMHPEIEQTLPRIWLQLPRKKSLFFSLLRLLRVPPSPGKHPGTSISAHGIDEQASDKFALSTVA